MDMEREPDSQPNNGPLFVIDRLLQFGAETIEVLKVAACLGFYFKPKLLEYVLGHPVDTMIQEALDKQILSCHYNGG